MATPLTAPVANCHSFDCDAAQRPTPSALFFGRGRRARRSLSRREREKMEDAAKGIAAASSLPRGLLAPGLLGAVAIVVADVVVHHVHGESGPFRHQGRTATTRSRPARSL